MRALVTGGAGFIGSHLVDRLKADGAAVEIVDWKLGASIQERGEIDDADVIYHLASPVGPIGVLHQAGWIASEVLLTTDIVREWALLSECRLVYVSTSEVYGSGGSDSEADICAFQPETSARKEYAVAKLAAETMLLNTRGLDVVIVRPFNVAGPRQSTEGGFVLPRFVRQALRDEHLTVYIPGTQRRAFTHVLDIVDGLILAYERGTSGGVYNLGEPANVISIRALADEVIAAVGSGTVTVVDPVTLHGPAFREAPDKLPNADKAWRELGWRATRTRAQIIEDVVADAA